MIGSVPGTRRVSAPADGALWAAVEGLVGGEYELHGELSDAPDGRRVVYVATRRNGASGLVLLVVDRSPDVPVGATGSYELTVHDVLDETIPVRDTFCRHCAHRLVTWAAACPACGQSTALMTAIARAEWSEASARAAVSAALGSECTMLGSLPTAAGSVIAIARDDQEGAVVAMAIERIGGRGGATRAVPAGRLRHPVSPPPVAPPSSVPAPVAPAIAPPAAAPHRSSPHSGEIGPLPPADRGLLERPLVLVCPSCRSRYEDGLRFCPSDGSQLVRAPDGSDLVGRVLEGKFRVERLLGEGGMGRVYLAEHVRIGRRCALKVLSPQLVGHPGAIKRFGGEARNASRIAHPNVATVYDFEETEDGLVYIVLEYIDGETLGALLAREQRLDAMRAVRIARDTAAALAAAHDLGIVHRDLKPDNIMIARASSGADVVKVVDFGIAKALEGSQTSVTMTGHVVGTPRYMSPEQFAGAGVDARSDIFSLGCVLYEALTGRPAYDAPVTTQAGTGRTARQQPRFREGAPRAIDAIITKAMGRTPEVRYQTAREMSDALDAVLAHAARKARAGQRALALRIAGAAAAVLIVGMGTVFVARRVGSRDTVTASAGVVEMPTIAAAGPMGPNAYLRRVETIVRDVWRQSRSATPSASESADYTIAVDETGRVVDVRSVRASDAAYSAPIAAAIQHLAGFGPPPAALGRAPGDVLRIDLHFGGVTVSASPAAEDR